MKNLTKFISHLSYTEMVYGLQFATTEVRWCFDNRIPIISRRFLEGLYMHDYRAVGLMR
jgi:hypothetical protein